MEESVKLTAKQEKVLDCIKKYQAEHGFPPAVREICEILGEIIGENYNDKLIDTLFSNFCLGK